MHVLCIGIIIIVLSGPFIDIIDKLLDDSPLVYVGLSEKSMPLAPVRGEPVDHNFTNRVATRRYLLGNNSLNESVTLDDRYQSLSIPALFSCLNWRVSVLQQELNK